MRQIKFRAWDTETNEMSYDFSDRNWLKVCIESPYVELMQYTGLQDHNGKDICDGDIVFADSNEYSYIVKFGTYPNEHDKEYECTGWYAELIGSDYKCSLQLTEGLEVIGNIYQNPELLELTPNE